MQEDTVAVTQKYAYNGALSRYMSSILVKEDSQRALAAASGEEILISSPADETGEAALPMPGEVGEEVPPTFSEETILDDAKEEPEQLSSELEEQEQQMPLFLLEKGDKQELVPAETKSPVETLFPSEVETPLPPSLPSTTYAVSVPQKQKAVAKRGAGAQRDVVNATMVQEQCRHLCISLFLREQSPVRSLGFTSSLRGEGKSFLAMITADMLAKDSNAPVTLLECDWEHPCLHEHFGFGQTPGLAEWLRGECSEMAIRQEVSNNLTIIPAGNGKKDAVKLLQRMRQKGIADLFGHSGELLVVDLPAIIPSAYGVLAADLVESLVVVVRAGVTPGPLVRETCVQLKDAPVNGLLLNQVQSRVPRWIRQLV